MAATDTTKYLNKTEYEVALSRIKGYIKSREDGVVDSQDSEFLYRQSPNVDLSNVVADSVKGKTVVWNQIASAGRPQATLMSGSTVSDDGFCKKYTWATATNFSRAFFNTSSTVKVEANHKYYESIYFKQISGITFASGAFYFTLDGVGATTWTTASANVKSNARFSRITVPANSGTSNVVFYQQANNAGTIAAGGFVSLNLFCVDLTLMFGAGNEPATVEEFEAMFPLPYYSYNAGELISLNATGIKTVGRNLWDEEWEVGAFGSTGVKNNDSTRIRTKNYIPVSPNTSYFIKFIQASPNNIGTTYYYDAGLNYISSAYPTYGNPFTTPSNAAFMMVGFYPTYGVTYNHDICINLSDPSFNGQYEPYKTSTLSLSIPSMTSGGTQIFPNGMKSAGAVYDEAFVDEDGFVRKVVKRVGSVDMGTLTWSGLEAPSGGGHIRFQAALSNVYASSYKPNIKNAYGFFADGAPIAPTYKEKALAYYNGNIYTYVDVYSTAASFKTAMSGVMLYYELATPIEYTLDTPIYVGSRFYMGGTQTVLPENTSTPTTAPFRGTFKYYAGALDVYGLVMTETAKYLPLVGGTITGALNVNGLTTLVSGLKLSTTKKI